MLKFNIGDKVTLNPSLDMNNYSKDYQEVFNNMPIGIVTKVYPLFILDDIEYLWPYNVYFPGFSETTDDLFPCFSWELAYVGV